MTGLFQAISTPWADLGAEALANLRANGQRTLLAVVGIAIGAGCTVAMLSVGRMAGREALRPFAAMGVDLAAVRLADAGGEVRPLSPERLTGIASAPGVAAVSGYVLGQAEVPRAAGGPPPTVLAVDGGFAGLLGLEVAQGRLLAASDRNGLVAVVGHEVVQSPLLGRRDLRLGERIQVGGYDYAVVGVLSPATPNALTPADLNHSVLIPFGSAARTFGAPEANGAILRMAPDADADRVAAAIRAAVAAGPDGQLSVQSARQAVAAIAAQKRVQTRLLAALGSISLLVGGVGVMNVMLMSLVERRREIGLRAALGATPRDIQALFLAEALALAAIGGGLGLAGGVAAAALAAAAAHWPFAIDPLSLPLGALLAGLVGVGFGVYPAIRASRLDPSEALRAT